jgi:hypothetical protein
MRSLIALAALLCASVCLHVSALAGDVTSLEDPHAPHTPTLIFYLTGAESSRDADTIQAAVQKLKSASTIEMNIDKSYTRIRFDSHVVSYHQVAQTLSDAGNTLGKNYNPCLIFFVSEYSKADNAADVDAIFAGKRLNTRVKVSPLDPQKGIFAIHFHPLKVDPKSSAPQGFNGGHLHHPISDPTPRGLGLTSGYASEDDPTIAKELKAGESHSSSTQPS